MYEIDREKFGEFLAELRKEKGIKQKELAEKLYVSDKAVSKWETGHSIPDVSLLVPLAEVLGVTVTELLECKRMDAPESMDASRADDLVKTVIELSEEERSRKRKGNMLIYLICVFVACVEMYCLYRLSEIWDFFLVPLLPVVGLSILFGAYIWLFIKEKLPSYYDENKINVYVDGVLHINMPGVCFNNNNWPYIVRALRMWSASGMVVFPMIYVLLEKVIGYDIPGVLLVVLLTFFLGGLFVPIYVLGRKHQYGDKPAPRVKAAPQKSIFVLVVIAVVMGLAMWGLLGGVGTISSGTRVMYVSNEGRSHWSASYQYFNGFIQRNLWVAENEDGFDVVITSEEGSMDVEVRDENGNVIFAQENIQTGTYEIKATGKVVVRIDCEKHRGSFDIR
ncbi:MAG: helix-turn-helix transcriptional regulator [Lachnospiraceae bacterium]|nr:helix-turn-helix transcriptional regulator [Lachnospiraceae bacterium]